LLKKRVWRRAASGHVDAIRYINDHCKKDVLVLKGVYEKLRPYAKEHPRIGLGDTCRVCGGPVIGGGIRVTTTKGPRQRMRCTTCGHWETRPLSLKSSKTR
jgi:hypothetical protein